MYDILYMRLNYSLLKRFGNKKMLLNKIDFTKFFPPTNKNAGFLDLFCGTGVVSFYYLDRMKKRGRRVAVRLNDKDDRLIRFFEYLQNHRAEFENALKFRWAGSERVMERPFTEIDDAVHFYLENQDSTDFKKPLVLYKDFSEFGQILDYHKVRFISEDWKRALELLVYDFYRLKAHNSSIVVYADPPYDNTSGYKSAFDIDEFLKGIKQFEEKAKEHNLFDRTFIFVTLNKTERVEDAFDGWYRKKLSSYIYTNMRKDREEMIYSNKPIQNRTNKNIAAFFRKS